MQRVLSLMVLLLAAMAVAAPSAATEVRQSGRRFLSPDLLRLQDDPAASPVGLWLERGAAAWTAVPPHGKSCAACHGSTIQPGQAMASAATRYPRLSADGRTLINLEDQIRQCWTRSGATVEDEEVLALSALLHDQARGLPINVQPPSEASARAHWEQRLDRARAAYTQRMGRMNLACVHCHDLNVGKTLRTEVVSPGHPTGFPVYRMRWQTLGSLERRLRACYSGVQAELPPPGSPLLRDLELLLKVRAQGLPIEGPSIRR